MFFKLRLAFESVARSAIAQLAEQPVHGCGQ